MAKTLIIAEQTGENIKKISLELITAAKKVGSEIDAFTWGPNTQKVAETLSAYGVTKLFEGEGEEFSKYNNEAFTATIADLIRKEKYDYVFTSANPFGKDLGPRLAARLSTCYLSDCTDITPGDNPVFIKPIFAGKILTDARPQGVKHVIASLRPNVFPAPQESDKKTPEIVKVKSPVTLGDLKTKLKELKSPEAQKIDLQEANVIISAGRGIKEKENFKILDEMAGILGAAVGASRAAVDAGFAPGDIQVGQTGKVVNPSLYIALGISGAIQHLAGMRTSKVIVAVNKDADAPIFKFADYGIVGDIFKIVPELTKEFKKLLSE